MILDLSSDKNVQKITSIEQIRHFFINNMEGGEICVEFGVFEGKSINDMSSFKPNGIFWGFDSFEGLPEDWVGDFVAGTFKTEFSRIKFNNNVYIHKGLFDETLPTAIDNDIVDDIKFIHIDCDLYSSTKYIFDTIGHIILKNKCTLLFDEFHNYEGSENDEYKVFMDWVKKHNVKYQITAINPNHQQIVIQIL